MRDLLLLMRAPLAASAASNLLVGALLLRAPGAPFTGAEAGALALLALASCFAYWGGMVLNDLFDLERDRVLHPGRPLPSGRVSPVTAATLGAALLLAHVGCAALAGMVAGGHAVRGALGGTVLAACILAYDGGLKSQRLAGALMMGSCRFVNALLGAFTLGAWPAEGRLTSPLLLYALLLLIDVTYLTVLSFYEDEDAPAEAVATGCLGTALAPAALCLAVVAGPIRLSPAALLGAVPLLLIALAQGFLIIEEGTKARGERPTRALLRGLWLFDIAVLLGFGHVVPALVAAGAAVVAMGAAKLLFMPARAATPG
jgi:4-hydroxybenzoate polyprenyltransferase